MANNQETRYKYQTMTNDQKLETRNQEPNKRWRRTARSRLRFELGGLAFGLKMGASPEDYARHLWSTGAREWMRKADATAGEYLLKEAEAFAALCPEVSCEPGAVDGSEASLTFTRGCLGGWGKDPWTVARSLGLTQNDVCRYCQEAFRVWSEQLGLDACPEPQSDGTCVLKAESRRAKMSGRP